MFRATNKLTCAVIYFRHRKQWLHACANGRGGLNICSDCSWDRQLHTRTGLSVRLPDGGGATAAPAACCLESPWKSDMRFHGLSKSPITPEKVASRFFKKKKKNRWRGLITRYILATKSLSWQHCPAELEVPCICYRRVSIAGAATEEIRSQWK